MDIFVDESGNIELGIRDNKQLFFTIGSHNALETTCSQAVNLIYHANKPKELKFSNIKRNLNGIDKIKRIFKFILTNNHQIFTYTIYKPFYVLNSFVTLCQDEILEDQDVETGDVDFIKTRRNFVWFYTLFTIGPTFLRDLVYKYQEFILHKDQNTFKKLIEHIGSNKKDPLNIFEKIKCYLVAHNSNIINSIQKSNANNYNKKLAWLSESSWIDITLSCTRFLLKFWGENFNDNFNIYHDQSIPLEKQKDFFLLMPEIDDCSIDSFQFIDSKEYTAVQIADIIAGTFNFWYEKFLLKSLDNIDKKSDKKFKKIDRLVRLIPNQWHMHLIPDIEGMTIQQRNIIKSYEHYDQRPDIFCFTLFSS